MVNIEINSERWLNPKNLRDESWRVIDDTPQYGTYLISNYGRLKRMPFYTGRRHYPEMIFRLFVNRTNGYYKCRVGDKTFLVHRLVAIAFIKRCRMWEQEVDHRNGDKSDNRARNLRWASRKKNTNNPVTVWERKNRYGMAGNEPRPNPNRTQTFLSEEESKRQIELGITRVLQEYRDKRGWKRTDIQ